MLSTILSGTLTFTDLITMLLSYGAVVFLTLPLHEWAHAVVATALGDPTPRWHGRLSVNPLKHLDIFGTAMLVLFGFGFAKPVPVNPRYFKNPRVGMAIVAAAGPVSNLLLASVALGVCRVLIALPTVNSTWLSFGIGFLSMVAQVNVSLAVFNLLPLPPLDGYRIVSLVLPSRITFWVERNERLISWGLMALIAFGKLDVVLSYARQAVWTLLMLLFGF